MTHVSLPWPQLVATHLFPLCFYVLRCQSPYLVSYSGKSTTVLAVPAAFSIFTQFRSVTQLRPMAEKRESRPYEGQHIAPMLLSASLLCHWPTLGSSDTVTAEWLGKERASPGNLCPRHMLYQWERRRRDKSHGVAHSRARPCGELEMNEIPFTGGAESRQ